MKSRNPGSTTSVKTQGRKIRVMVVDDHAVVRSGLQTFLTTIADFELVGDASDGAEAVARCGLLKPDVVLMDLMMPGTNGVEATRLLRAKWPSVQVIALTSFEEDSLVQDALQAGAIGYLMKTVTAGELAAAIRAACEGKMTLSPEAAQALVRAKTASREANELTEREREVLKLMVDGMDNAEIASTLVVSLSTVKYHISNILSKLGVENRVAAVTTAIHKNLV